MSSACVTILPACLAVLLAPGFVQGRQTAPQPVTFDESEVAFIESFSPLPAVPDDPTNAYDHDPEAARLGQFLFYDQRLSSNGQVACVSCHDPAQSWTDGRQVGLAPGAERPVERHTMSLWNVAYNRWFFWDGRADSLWSQALIPLENPLEHDFTRLQAAHVLHDDAKLKDAYERVFGPLPPLDEEARFPAAGRPIANEPEHPHAIAWTGMTSEDRDAVNRVFANVGKAIAAFETKLVSRRSPFDIFVEGLREGDLRKQRGFSADARRGLKLFLGKARCFVCHTGANFTDLEFHNDRIPGAEGVNMDPGRFGGIEPLMTSEFSGVGPYSDDPDGKARDKVAFLRRPVHEFGAFKTPTLRNAALTAPYMHQGQFATLEDVIHFYSTLENAVPTHHAAEKILIAVNLLEHERRDLIAFLRTLTDTSLDPVLLAPPEAP